MERKNSVVRTLTQRLLIDASYFGRGQETHSELEHILSKAVYRSNVLYGSLKMRSFELARCYNPILIGLPRSKAPSQLLDAHNEQIARRALALFQKPRIPNTLTANDLSRDDSVYFFRGSVKFRVTETAFEYNCRPHFVNPSKRQNHAGKPICAAYEEFRKAPSSPLLTISILSSHGLNLFLMMTMGMTKSQCPQNVRNCTSSFKMWLQNPSFPRNFRRQAP